MIMYRFKSRPKEVARRIFVYFLMTASMITLLVLLTLTIIGYRYNFNTRTVERTGLVQFDSFPRGARVSIDGITGNLTQTKSMILPGQHQFSMQLEGYHPWQKTATIEAGTVTWLSYVRLVPEEKNNTLIHDFPEIRGVMASDDKRYLAGFTKDQDGAFELALIDLDNSRQPKISQALLQVEQLSGFSEVDSEHDLAVVDWSQSSKSLLVRHDFTLQSGQAASEWLWMDRESPSEPVNIQRLVNLPIKKVQLTNDRQVLILQDNGDIRRVTIDSGVISRPLIGGASWFDFDHRTETISFVGQRADEQVAGIYKDNWQQPVMLLTRLTDDDQSLHIRVSRYFNQDAVVIGDGASIMIYRGPLPASDEAKALFIKSAKSFTLNRPAENLQISRNGRFVIAEDDKGFVSYDIEHLQVSQEIKKYDSSPIRWLDDHHVWQIDESGQLIIQEFDGVNSNQLMPVSSGYDVVLTKDGRYVYGFLNNDSASVELRQLSMVIR